MQKAKGVKRSVSKELVFNYFDKCVQNTEIRYLIGENFRPEKILSLLKN